MTRLYNDPEDFLDQMVDGFVAANSALVRRVHGGVVRARRADPGTVAVVTGGGSGHYPAFAGLVGEGLAHGAAMGNLFASPSWQQVRSVAKAAQTGAGVLLTYGNYAGDVLNFDHAQDRLRQAGIPTRTVAVTDDISSAGPGERQKRRGIAGDLTVLKCAAAAAEEGLDLEAVHRIAAKANERTRSFGVAFSGCTLPGAAEPLFTVPEGQMAIGMGIHGEPGLGEAPLPSADELARLLVNSVLTEAELPDGMSSPDGARAAVLLNGLGSVKYEELFVVFAKVHELLTARGITVVQPECGELVTSFDLAGASLTLFWLDDELERLWRAPAHAPGYRKALVPDVDPEDIPAPDPVTHALGTVSGSEESRRAAALVSEAIARVAEAIDARAEELGRIDAVAGDGDHGIGMRRGSSAAAAAAQGAAQAGAGAGTALALAADAWSDRAGGTSGALWGAALETIGAALGDTEPPTAAAVADGVCGAAAAILEFGAAVGDKTMVDALVPFAETLRAQVSAGHGLTSSWAAAAAAAQAAAAGTAQLIPKMGRARPHAEKSLGTPDAGAVSFALAVTTIAQTLTEHRAASTARQEATP